MLFSKKLLLISFVFFCCVITNAQVVIPAFTGYAVPLKADKEDESVSFSKETGVQHWADTKQELQYFFNVSHIGSLGIAISMKNNVTGSKLQVTIANKKFMVNVPAGGNFKKIRAGTIKIAKPDFYSIQVKAISKTGKTIADIESIELSGEASEAIQFNAKPRKNAASVHLRYTAPDTAKVVSFYSEIKVPAGFDPIHTYYMACGFARGYFGIQVNSPTERRVIFSVWDAGKEAADRNKVDGENKVKLLGKGAGVFAGDFGNEGTGGPYWFAWYSNFDEK